ncbi:MAG: glycosyltransferase [Bacteroidales bacterium]
MLIIVIAISLTSIILYCILLSFFTKGLKKNEIQYLESNNNLPFCSILIPCRNEEGNIENILSDLLQQDYDKNLHEIIVIDDHSSDKTKDIVYFFKNGNEITYLSLNNSQLGKKAALLAGLGRAKGNLILTIDADCRVGKFWLKSFAKLYAIQKPHLIIGIVDIFNPQTIWEKIVNLEFLSLIGAGIGAANMNKPFMCNGANLAFCSSVTPLVVASLKSNISSGDDMFVLHSLKAKQKKIITNMDYRAISYTYPPKNFTEFLHQKIRWASKTIRYKDTFTLSIAFLIFFVNVTYFISLVASLFFPILFLSAIGIIVIKTIADVYFFKIFLSYMKKYKLKRYIVIVNIFYPFYIILISILSMFVIPRWKGRIISI